MQGGFSGIFFVFSIFLPSSTFLVNGDAYILPYRLHTYLGFNSNGSP